LIVVDEASDHRVARHHSDDSRRCAGAIERYYELDVAVEIPLN
jgi:hypothetical protein